MAVAFMRKLEEEPETYDSKFTSLTKGVNVKVHNWVLDQIQSDQSILEIGSGTGSLASKMVSKGNVVVAIDNNIQMINFAKQKYSDTLENGALLYRLASFTDLPVEKRSVDVIVSTFLLSELRPLEQQIFLRNAWKALKPNGRLILAAEFVPSGFWKVSFKIKRWWFKKKLRRLRLKSTFLVKWFFNYIEPIGFRIGNQKKWKHGSIQAIELLKINDNGEDEPDYYRPKTKKFKGIISQLRIYRCLFTGQIDRVPIEPGIYKSGNPNNNSPIIVTANYEYTYIKLMRDLQGIDAWVLCLDSNGINVWCAARGDDFGNKQLLEAIEATDIRVISEKKTLILPQLSAGGVAVPQLPEKFPFKVKYGPVWSKDLKQFLSERPVRKPDSMKLAKFTLSHRIRAGITHTTFLFRKIFLIPIIAILLSFFALNNNAIIWWLGELVIWIVLSNVIISIFFPLSKFSRKFIVKAIFFGCLSIFFIGAISWIFHSSYLYLLSNLVIYFWITFFSTMSFSGYTMSTSPKEIQAEYPVFRKINLTLIILVVILLGINIIFFMLNIIN